MYQYPVGSITLCIDSVWSWCWPYDRVKICVLQWCS